jgi:hypothetical protein
MRGRAGTRGRGGHGPSPRRGGFGCSGRGRGEDGVICQVCGKKNHTGAEYWYRFDESYQSSQKLAASIATSSYQIDPSWYMDSSATYHITGELEKLTIRNKYQGGDQVHTASGSGMNISHIGHTTFPTPKHNILLKDILYVPRTRKNLVSIHRLTANNSIFMKPHPTLFLIKDRKTKTTLLRG